MGGILFSRRESFELHLKPYFADCRGAFVDIGANLGYWSLFVAECKAKRADSSAIFAFEPVPENFRLLQQNVRVSRNRAAIRTEQAALGAQFGLISMAASNDDPGSCFVNRNALGQIQQIRLDDYVGIAGLDRIGLIKMDVEGYEYDVLCGARNTILEHKPLVLCEVIEPYLARNGRTPAALFEFFAELGYAGTRVCAEGLNGKPGYFGNGDYLFCAT